MRRAFADTLVDLLSTALLPPGAWGGVRVTSLLLDVPLEVRLTRENGEWEFHADVPGWRWQTGLEELRGRLKIAWQEGGGV